MKSNMNAIVRLGIYLKNNGAIPFHNINSITTKNKSPHFGLLHLYLH